MADDNENKLPPPEEETEFASREEVAEALEEEELEAEEAVPPPASRQKPEAEKPRREMERLEEEEDLTPPLPRRKNLPRLRDRAAAGLLDIFFLGYLYWGTYFAYNYIIWKEFLHPVPLEGTHPLVLHGVFLLLAFLYFFISEGVFFTTPGKFFCRLSVQTTDGRPPSLLAIAVRNILRIVDYALLFSPTWILLEKTNRQQRLGDLLAGTVVCRHSPPAGMRIQTENKTASASARWIMGTIDFAFLAVWLGSFCLLIDYQRPVFSFLIVLLIPTVYILWCLMWEGFFQGTFGQWLFGCKLAKEDGSTVGFSEAVIRAVMRPLDIIAYPTLFLSNRNQTAADTAAGTVVVYARRSWSVLIGLVFSLMLIFSLWFVGQQNPNHFLTSNFKFRFIPPVFTYQKGFSKKKTHYSQGKQTPAAIQPSAPLQGLYLQRFSYLDADRKTERQSAAFKPGETVYFSFDVIGFQVRNNEAWIQEDLTVRYPDNKVGFKKESIVDFHQLLKDPKLPLEIVNTLTLPENAQPGHYTLILLLHDRFSNRRMTEQRTFRVER